jgi:hypothetical protein
MQYDLRYYGNATNSLLHNMNYYVTIETPSRRHIAPSLRLLVPSSPQVRCQSVHMSHYHLRPKVALDLVDRVVDLGDVW